MDKTVFFDLGNVLLFFSHQRMCQQIAKYCQINEELVTDAIFTQGYGERYERGLIDSHAVHQHFCKLSGKNLEFIGLMKAIADIFEPNEPLTSIIKALKKNNVRLVLLSNTSEAHFDYAYTHFPILHFFDAYALSYQVGALKPEPKIFEHALSLANAPMDHCFYTDDIKEFIDAARGLGISAEQFTTPEHLIMQLTSHGFLTHIDDI